MLSWALIKGVWPFLPRAVRLKLGRLYSRLKFASRPVPRAACTVFVYTEKGLQDFPGAKLLDQGGELPRYSLIATCLNEASSAERWLAAVFGQEHLASEIIVCDGGSSDGTPEVIMRARDHLIEGGFGEAAGVSLRVIRSVERLNISEGRNRAAEEAAEDLLLFSDFGSAPAETWALRLSAPFKADPMLDAAGGFYRAEAPGELAQAVSHFIVPKLGRIEPERFLPSGRSFACRKVIWKQTGRFPEHLSRAGEDSLFGYYLKFQTRLFAFVPEAVVSWQMPNDARKLWRMIAGYAQGDAEGMKLFIGQYLQLLETLFEIALSLLFAFIAALAGFVILPPGAAANTQLRCGSNPAAMNCSAAHTNSCSPP